VGPPHHPPERAVPLRAARATSRGAALLGSVGLTTREACGDTVATSRAATSPARARTRCSTSAVGRGRVPALPAQPARAAPARASSRSTSPAARPTAARRCSTTSASSRQPAAARRHARAGFRVFIAGGLGANPHPAQALEEFTSREDLWPTIEGDPARASTTTATATTSCAPASSGSSTRWASTSCASASSRSASSCLASATWPGRHPRDRAGARRRPAGRIGTDGVGRRRRARSSCRPRPVQRWETANVVRGAPTAR
jgi:hypothetical protein